MILCIACFFTTRDQTAIIFSQICRRTAYHCINSREMSHTETQTHTQTQTPRLLYLCSIYAGLFNLITLIGRSSSILVFGHGKGKLFCLWAHR
jgi:hypothetical protein